LLNTANAALEKPTSSMTQLLSLLDGGAGGAPLATLSVASSGNPSDVTGSLKLSDSGTATTSTAGQYESVSSPVGQVLSAAEELRQLANQYPPGSAEQQQLLQLANLGATLGVMGNLAISDGIQNTDLKATMATLAQSVLGSGTSYQPENAASDMAQGKILMAALAANLPTALQSKVQGALATIQSQSQEILDRPNAPKPSAAALFNAGSPELSPTVAGHLWNAVTPALAQSDTLAQPVYETLHEADELQTLGLATP
jgi:hypothetical protein